MTDRVPTWPGMEPLEPRPEGARPKAHTPVDRHGLAPTETRYDGQGRRLCSAWSRTGKGVCMAPAVTGMTVCRQHGGGTPQARRKAQLRLLELVDPAIATLAREMTTAEKSVDRQRAANSILDRAGYGRAVKIEAADARALLVQRIMEMRADAGEELLAVEHFAHPDEEGNVVEAEMLTTDEQVASDFIAAIAEAVEEAEMGGAAS